MTGSEIIIRDIEGNAEIRAVEAVQKDVWQLPDLDVVPLTQLAAAKVCGGTLIGAFDGEILAGFVYGFSGVEEAETTHHSHMLAVGHDYRSLDVGYRLKVAQREQVLAQGLKRITWTFDPLQSLNAHFNFTKLGVLSDRYFVNFYGEEAASFLHRNGTDRLWVSWDLDSARVRSRLNGIAAEPYLERARTILRAGDNLAPYFTGSKEGTSGELAVIEIPADITEVEHRCPELAARWRDATRKAFTEMLNEGYIVADFNRGNRESRSVGQYLLVRG